MLLFLRVLGGGLASSLMLGELWRSWGQGRPLMFVPDDFVFGVPLLIGAIVTTALTPSKRAFFAAGWALNVGMLYGSFFSKIVTPQEVQAGNWDGGVLTALIGVAFVVAIGGLIATLCLQEPREAFA